MSAEISAERPDINTYYSHIAHQIEREDGLINNRLNWFLTSESLLFAAFAVTIGMKQGAGSSDISQFIVYIVPLLGIVISIAALQGVKAAERALISLKNAWRVRMAYYLESREIIVGNEEYDDHMIFPRPHGPEVAWKSGRSFNVNESLPFCIGSAWIVIFLSVIAVKFDLQVHWPSLVISAVAAVLLYFLASWWLDHINLYWLLRQEVFCNISFFLSNPPRGSRAAEALTEERLLAARLQIRALVNYYSQVPRIYKRFRIHNADPLAAERALLDLSKQSDRSQAEKKALEARQHLGEARATRSAKVRFSRK